MRCSIDDTSERSVATPRGATPRSEGTGDARSCLVLEATMTATDRLRQFASEHEVTFRVLPEWGTDAHWHQQRVGFQIELHGSGWRDGDPAAVPSLDDPEVAACHDALREVATWAFGGGTDDVVISMDPFGGKVVQNANHSWKVEVVGHVLHRGDVRRPVDAAEEAYLGEVKKRLQSLDIGEH